MIILASASPRRRELLGQIGVDFEVCVSEAKEVTSAENPKELTLLNAQAKAMAVAKEKKDFWILGADTVVALDDKIYGKPKDESDAFNMLKTFANRTHEVITGIVLLKGDKCFESTAVTEVTFGDMTESDIKAYVATKEPMDKAGAYAVQGIAAKYIKEIIGSYSNVVGLPLYELNELFKEAEVFT